MQYVKKKVSTSGSLRTVESHKNTLCSQNKDNLSTHIFNMGSGGVAASRNLLIANNPSTCEQGLLCEIGKVLAAPNRQLYRRSKKISNIPSSAAVSEIYCLKLLSEKTHPSRNILAVVPTANLGHWALYLSKLVTFPFRLATIFSEPLMGKYFANNTPFPARMRAHRNIGQVLLSYSQFIIFRRLLISLSPIPPG
jgi:hypothetical protein